MYLFSDFIKWILKDIVKYRKEIIRKQLEMCFPEKSYSEINNILNQYYRNLADLVVESIKGFSMSDRELRKRWKLIGTEHTEKYLSRGISVIINTAHINNFEWGTMAYALQSNFPVKGVYKPLSNNCIENYLKQNRARTGMELLPMQNVSQKVSDMASSANIFIFVSDQSPSKVEKAHWIKFFGIDTAFIHGVGNYAHQYNLPVFYCDIRRVRRGYYEANLSELAAGNEPEDHITRLFANKVESVIKEDSAGWLWSHNRWKHKKMNTESNL